MWLVFGLLYWRRPQHCIRESAMPDSEENRQADAGSRLLSKTFSVRSVVV